MLKAKQNTNNGQIKRVHILKKVYILIEGVSHINKYYNKILLLIITGLY